nr:basic proline-rich protein-like [Vulpes vulpes]
MPPPSHNHVFGSKGTGEPRAPPARRPTAPMWAPRSEAQSGRSGPHGLPCPGPEAEHGPAGVRRARGEVDSRAAGPRLPPYTHLITPSLPPRHYDPPWETEAPWLVSPVSAGEAARVQEESVSSGPAGVLLCLALCIHPARGLPAPPPAGRRSPPSWHRPHPVVRHSPPQRAAGHPQRRPPNQPPVMGVMPGGHMPTGDWSSLPPWSLPPTDTAALRTCGPGLKGLLHTLQP